VAAAGHAEGFVGPLERLDQILAEAVDVLVQAQGAEAADPFRGLYISARDARRWASDPRRAAILGVGEGDRPSDRVVAGSTLDQLRERYGLSGFDLDLVILALAPELDLAYERLYAFLQDDVSRRAPSVDLALTLLCAALELKVARRAHFASDAPLVRSGLLTLVPDRDNGTSPLPAHALRLDDTAVRFLLGQGGLDPRLASVASLTADVVDAHTQLALGESLEGAALRLHFSGPPTSEKLETARAIAAQLDRPLLAVDLQYALEDAARFDETVALAFREAALHDAVVYAEPLDELLTLDGPQLRRLTEAVAWYRGAVVLAGSGSSEPRGLALQGLVQVPFALPGFDLRRERWRTELLARGTDLDPADLDRLAGRFRLTVDQIADAVTVAVNRSLLTGTGGLGVDELFEAARSRSDTGLAGLARKIEPLHEWDDLVLEDDAKLQLEEMCERVVQRDRVLDEWGLGSRMSRGRGVTALFTGPSGTGKTTAAELIAGRLGLDLYRIDLSGVVSKYIGETEKNLRRIFAAAENANAILFFDEADALFGKRSEVRDSHDRFANIEVAYLLQEMEDYEGVAILATNMRQNMDPAFVRRLQFVVEFPFPDADARARIWDLHLAESEARRDPRLDVEALGREYRLSGGSIGNIALAAAYLAASDDGRIGRSEVEHAARREFAKLGRVAPGLVAADEEET
jgi:ATPase family associated with various cellular activities (AAA)